MKRHCEPDSLRGIAILFVVAVHAFAYLRIPIGGAWAGVWFIVHQTAVPAFFLADGLLHGMRHQKAMSGAEQISFLTRSARRLLVPWSVFSLLYLALRILGERSGSAGGESVMAGGVAGLPLALWHGVAAGQLYFLPALMVVRIVTLPLHRLVAGHLLRAVALAIALMFAWRLVLETLLPVPATGTDPLLAAATGLCFAAVGWALAELSRSWRLAAPALAALMFFAVGLLADGRLAGMCLQTGSVLSLWCLALSLPAIVAAPSVWLGRRSMQVYLLHGPVLLKLACVGVSLGHVGPALGLPIAVVVTTVASVGVAWVLGRIGLGWLWQAPPDRLRRARLEALPA